MINRLVLTTNAYFYKVLKPISKNIIDKVQIAASFNKQGNYVYKKTREKISVGGNTFQVSLLIFKQQMLPGFLTPGPEMELRYSYLLIVEFGLFLIVSKRGTTEFISILEKKINELDYSQISGYKISPTTLFPKISVSNLDTSKGSMKRATYEAPDVKEVLSTLSAGHKVVTGLKLKNRGINSTNAPATSRINDLGHRENLDFFCAWSADQCNRITSYKRKTNYLDNFAELLEYKVHIKTLTPTSILFDFSSLLDGLDNGSIAGIYFLNSNQRQRDIDLNIITSAHDLCMDIQYKKKQKTHPIKNSIDNTLKLKLLKNSIAVQSDKLNRIYIQYTNGSNDNLLSLINRESLFIISFDVVEVRYALKTLFRDSKLLGNIAHFLQAFEADNILTVAASEKGNCLPASNSFDSGCLFEIIESHYAADCDYLLCDDLGDEWADYIGFSRNNFIRFYHAKHSTKAFSASAFHDLISQALKNIGNFNFNQNLASKKNKINGFYGKTAIHRLRKGKNVTTCFKQLSETYNNPNSTKEICLVINFLSKSELENQLKLLSIGKAKNQTVQVLWLLASLIGECMEKGIKVKILTKP